MNVFMEEMGEDELELLMGGEESSNQFPKDSPREKPSPRANSPHLSTRVRSSSEIKEPAADLGEDLNIDQELLARQFIIEKVNASLSSPLKNLTATSVYVPKGKVLQSIRSDRMIVTEAHVNSSAVFGIPLVDLYARYSSLTVTPQGTVPTVFFNMLKRIRQLPLEGVFKVNASADHMKDLKEHIDNGKHEILLEIPVALL